MSHAIAFSVVAVIAGLLFAFPILICMYVFYSLGLMEIAKRRGDKDYRLA